MKIVITGASSGLGRAVAELFIKEGWQVVVCARRLNKLEELKALSDKVSVEALDVNDTTNAPQQLMKMLSENGDTDIYFHAAGIGCHNKELDIKKEIDVIKTDCLGFACCIDTAFNYFRKKGKGHIAAISSIAGTKGLGASPSYSASKAMNNTYLQCLAQLSTMIKANIKFTDIRPGFVATDLLDKNKHYPMLMKTEYAAKKIYKAIIKKKRVAIIDFRYAILVFLWKLIPNFVWERLSIDAK